MSLVEHLAELRRRVLFCLAAAILGMLAAYSCYDPWILDLLKGPLDTLAGRTDNPFVLDNPLLRFLKSSSGELESLNLNLHFIGPTEGFMMKVKASLFAGAILTSPFIFYQVWLFVSAGLTKRERKTVRGFLPASFVLFMCGALLAYLIMLPIILYFLVVVGGRGLVPMFTISKYVSLVIICCLALGLIFQMPLIILFLTKLGIVSPKSLTTKRKYAIFLMFVLAAVLTPPDIVTQMMMAVPMIVLYEVSVLLAKLAWARRQKALDE